MLVQAKSEEIANGKCHFSSNTSSNIFKNTDGANPWFTSSSDEHILGFFAGGIYVRQGLLTAAPLYKGEGMIRLQDMGQQLGKYPLISQSGVKTSLQAAPLSHSTLCLMKYLTTSVDKK